MSNNNFIKSDRLELILKHYPNGKVQYIVNDSKVNITDDTINKPDELFEKFANFIHDCRSQKYMYKKGEINEFDSNKFNCLSNFLIEFLNKFSNLKNNKSTTKLIQKYKDFFYSYGSSIRSKWLIQDLLNFINIINVDTNKKGIIDIKLKMGYELSWDMKMNWTNINKINYDKLSKNIFVINFKGFELPEIDNSTILKQLSDIINEDKFIDLKKKKILI